jgi:hypothetical protein
VNTREASPTVLEAENNLSESRGSLGAEDLAGADLADAVGERELQVLGDQLADVRALDVLALLDLDDAENLLISQLADAPRRSSCSLDRYVRGST